MDIMLSLKSSMQKNKISVLVKTAINKKSKNKRVIIYSFRRCSFLIKRTQRNINKVLNTIKNKDTPSIPNVIAMFK